MATGPAAVVYKHFEKLTDPRLNRGKNHELLDLVFLALTATICGAQSWVDVERFAKSKRDWFRRFIRLKQGVPSHDTFGRVFAVLDTGEFLSAMHAWVDAFQFLQGLRLRVQQRGVPLAQANRVDVRQLSELDRRILKEAFRQARKLQQRLAVDYPG